MRSYLVYLTLNIIFCVVGIMNVARWHSHLDREGGGEVLSWMRKNLQSPDHPHPNRTVDVDVEAIPSSLPRGFCLRCGGSRAPQHIHHTFNCSHTHSHIVRSEVSVCSKLCGHRSNGGAAKCSSRVHMLCSLRGHHTSHLRHIHIATLGPCANLTATICLAKCKTSLWG
jgi:hypothetical protein